MARCPRAFCHGSLLCDRGEWTCMLCGRTARVAPGQPAPAERWDGRDPEISIGSGSLAELIASERAKSAARRR